VAKSKWILLFESNFPRVEGCFLFFRHPIKRYYRKFTFLLICLIVSICYRINGFCTEENKTVPKGFSLQAAENTEVTHENFLNKGIRFTSSAKYSDSEKKVRIGVVKDNIFDTPFFAGFDLSGRWEEDDRYKLKGQGRDIYVGTSITKQTKLTLKFENQDINMYRLNDNAPQTLKDSAGVKKVGDLALLFERSTLDDRYYPTKGTHQSLGWDFARRGLASDCSFNRLTLQFRGYTTPGKFFTYAFRTKVGWVEEFGSSSQVPYFERFFAGGTGTIRGYKGKHVGPQDDQNFPLGGDLLWVNNFEVRFPIYKKISGAYFLDAGNLWVRPNKFNFGDLKCGTGFGLRFATKWGVARLDYGIRLTHEKDEPPSRIHASFGIPF
jgi:outer membrane protein assembly factor BamA